MLQLLTDSLAHWNPWRELEPFHRDFGRIFPLSTNWSAATNQAPVNLYTGEEGAKAVFRLPGWLPEWFDLSVEGNKLLLKGEAPAGQTDRRESIRAFSRVLNLPFRVDPDSVRADYRNGLLTVHLQRHQDEQPKKITIAA